MKLGSWFLGIGAALFAVACGGSSDGGGSSVDATGFVGIYQATSYTENAASCDAPGASILSPTKDPYFVITTAEYLNQKVATLISCSSVADCQDKRARQAADQGYSSDYMYTLSSTTNATTLAGFSAGSGSSEGANTCTGRTYSDHTLSVAADHGVHLESRTKKLADKPMEDGYCVVRPAESEQEAAKVPCASLEVLDGTFVQAM